MKSELLYVYLGDKGTITSPIFLEGAYHVKKYRLIADAGMLLTKDGINKHKAITIPYDDLKNWYEISELLI